MSPSPGIPGLRARLVSQLVYFDERKIELLSSIYPDPCPERRELDRILCRYSDTVKSILQLENAALINRIQTLVLIGSSVRIHCQDDGFEDTYILSLPEEADLDQKISMLSPIGKKLLLSSLHEELEIETPVHSYRLQVREINQAPLLASCG